MVPGWPSPSVSQPAWWRPGRRSDRPAPAAAEAPLGGVLRPAIRVGRRPANVELAVTAPRVAEAEVEERPVASRGGIAPRWRRCWPTHSASVRAPSWSSTTARSSRNATGRVSGAAGSPYASFLLGRTAGGCAHRGRRLAAEKRRVGAGGIAADRGVLDLDAPVSTCLNAGWTNATCDEEAAITIRHLLSMTSGLSPAPRVPGARRKRVAVQHAGLQPARGRAGGGDGRRYRPADKALADRSRSA